MCGDGVLDLHDVFVHLCPGVIWQSIWAETI